MRAWCLVAMMIVCGCADKTPADLLVDPLTEPIVSEAPVSVKGTLVNKAKQVLAEAPVAYGVTPLEVARVDDQGNLRCIGSGDVTVTVSGGGFTKQLPARCRLVERIEAPATLTWIAGEQPIGYEVKVIGRQNTLISDVKPTVSSSAPAVVGMGPDGPVPVDLGTATVTAEVAGYRAGTAVTVIKRLMTEPIALEDGASQTRALVKGKYLVQVSVTSSDGSGHGVTLGWAGAACNGSYEAQAINVTCDVPSAASFTLSNPTTFGFGPTASGQVSLFQLP